MQRIRFETPDAERAAWKAARGAAQKYSVGTLTWNVDVDKSMRGVRERLEAAGYEFVVDGRDCEFCSMKYLIGRKA